MYIIYRDKNYNQPNIDTNKIIELYEYGLSMKVVANTLNCSTTTVFRRLHKANIKIRTLSEALKKRKYSKEHRRKIGEATKKRIVSKETKEKISKTRLGLRHSEETKEKIGRAKIGKLNPSWQGGISFEPYGIEFNNNLKKEIHRRDNYTCQECGFTQEQLGYKLSVHHIDYNKQNNEVNNLISLCKSCHTKTCFNRNDWAKYYRGKINDFSH